MPEILFIGNAMESYPYRLLGVETLTPPEEAEDDSWVDRAFQGGCRIFLISENIACNRQKAVRELGRKLGPESAMTIVPDPSKVKSTHLALIREQTARSLGVDTWNEQNDISAGDNQ